MAHHFKEEDIDGKTLVNFKYLNEMITCGYCVLMCVGTMYFTCW